MVLVVLYSTGCPKCGILKQKLESSHVKFETNSDKDYMIKKGFVSVPMLEVDGNVMNFSEAVKWVNNRGE